MDLAGLADDVLRYAGKDYIGESGSPQATVRFDRRGFWLIEDGVETPFPISLDVPSISRPEGADYDRAGGRNFGLSSGGETLLYMYDIASESWSVLAQLGRYAGLSGPLFDPVTSRVILAGEVRWVSHGNGLNVLAGPDKLGLTVVELTKKPFSIPISSEQFIGLTDLYEPGNGPLPKLSPKLISGDKVVIEALHSHFDHPELDDAFRNIRRSYLIDMRTSEIGLLGFH